MQHLVKKNKHPIIFVEIMAEINVLSIESISKRFGDRELFSNLTLGIAQGDKVALIARNGAGKSTLLKIIAGKDYADEGRVVIRNGIRVGMLDQDIKINPEFTVHEAMMNTDIPGLNAIKDYETALKIDNPDQLQKAIAVMDHLNAWDIESQIHEMIGRLKLEDPDKKVKELSGGQKKRLALAQLLISEPDLMILDEPTNHLDLEMIEWLESYLDKKNNTLIMVTHDRYFLEVICNEIIELDQKKLYAYKGNYSYYLEKKAERQEVQKITQEKQVSFLRKEVDWIRRQPKARGTKSKSRIDKYHDIKSGINREKDGEMGQLNVKIPRMGAKILEFHKLTKSFDNKVLFDDFNYVYQRGEKIGLVGPNGSGKTTLVNMILSQLEPDKGKIVIGETLSIGHFSQDGLDVRDDKRVIEVIRDIAEYIQLEKGQKLTAAQLLERFMFDKKIQWQYVSTLSGGEKKRLYLLTILMRNPNFLILDEPTNDLDVYTLMILENYLQSFPGGLLVISHDRYFMDKLIDHLFVFDGKGNIRDFPGNYTQFRLQEEKKKKALTSSTKPKINVLAVADKKDSNKITYAERIELEKLEKELEALEQQKDELTAKLNNAGSDHEKLSTLGKAIKETILSIDLKTERWMELSEKDA
jgi:ATP-binding cassette subfamily F protein uup